MGLRSWASLTQAMLAAAATAAMRPMLSFRAIDLGAGGIELAIVAASYALLPIVWSFSLGRRIDRDGPFWYVIVGNVVFVLGMVLALVPGSLELLYVASAVTGFGQLLTFLAQQAATALVEPGERDRAFGLLSSMVAVGLTAGPLLAGSGAAWSARTLGWSEATAGLAISLLLCVLGLPLALGLKALRPTHQATVSGPSHRVVFQIVRTGGMWQALVAGATVLSAVDLLSAFLPLWATERGVSVSAVGMLLALRGLFTLISRVGADRLVRVFGRRGVLTASLVAAAGGLAVLPLVGVLGAGVTMVVLGAGLGLAQPLTMSWVSMVTLPGTIAAALGVRMAANRLAQATLPALVAVIAAGTGAGGVFWGMAVILAGASATMVRAPMGG